MKKYNLVEDGRLITLNAPLRVMYDFTQVCNLKCKFCYHGWEESNFQIKAPPLEKVKKIINECAKAGAVKLKLSGGEVLTFDYLEDVLRYAKNKRFLLGMVSNGFALTEDKAEMVAKYLHGCSISIHSPNEKLHDSLTQTKGSYEKAVNALQHLSNTKLQTGVMYSCLEDNYRHLFESIKNLIEKHKVRLDFLQVNRLIYTGTCKNLDLKDTGLSVPAYVEILEQIDRIHSELGVVVELTDAFPLCRMPQKHWKYINPCLYGIEDVSVDVDGNLKLCPCVTESFANLLEEPLAEVWTKNPVLLKFRSLGWLSKECRDCNMLGKCVGGCWQSDRPFKQPGSLYSADRFGPGGRCYAKP